MNWESSQMHPSTGARPRVILLECHDGLRAIELIHQCLAAGGLPRPRVHQAIVEPGARRLIDKLWPR